MGAAAVLYALDAVILIIVSDWLSVGFHAVALFGLFGGYRSIGQLARLEGGKDQLAAQPLKLLSLDLSKNEMLLKVLFWICGVIWSALYLGALWLVVAGSQ